MPCNITKLPSRRGRARRRAHTGVIRGGEGRVHQGSPISTGPDLLQWAAVHLVNAASRALLAHGRILFRGAKYERTLLADLPDLPDGFLDLSARLLALPTVEMCEELMALVEDFKDWGIPDEQSLSRFIRDNELAWLNGTLPPEAM